MFFQISPVRPQVKHKPVPKENESEKLEVLSLAPFTPNPKLFFEDVQVGTIESRKLLIENPSSHDLNLFVMNHIPPELNVIIKPEQITVERKSNTVLELIWQPLHEEFSRHMITISDGKRIQRDVPVAFKSVLPKKSKNVAKQKSKPQSSQSKQKISPTKKYYSTKPPYVSPKRYSPQKKYSPVKKYVPPKAKSPVKQCLKKIQNVEGDMGKQTIYPTADYVKNRSYTYKIKDKENFPPLLNVSSDSNIFLSPRSATFHLDYLQPIERRETYVVNGKKDESFSDPVFNDSLENISPTVTPRIEIDKCKKRQPLGVANQDNVSPMINEYIQQKLGNSPGNFNFEYKLMQLQSFCFTPLSTPSKQNPDFSPGLSSTIKIDNSDKNTPKTINAAQLFSTENRTFEFPAKSPNISTETYVKSNISTETYVKDNTSFETYVKGNLSGSTFTKEASVGDLVNLTYSPISFKVTTSPRTCKTTAESNPSSSVSTAPNLDGDSARQIIEANLWNGLRHQPQPLSSIKEESYINCSTRDDHNMSNKSFLKRKSDLNFSFTPPKRPNVVGSLKGWSKSGGTPIRISTRSSGLKLKKSESENSEVTAVLTKQDTNQVIIRDPFLLAATNLADPFMTPYLHINEEWLDQQQIDFKKWLNALLTPPEELTSEEQLVDVAKVWQECKNKEVDAAPTREMVSSKYLVSNKLNSLRKAAQNLFRSKEMSCVLSKVVLAVETGKLAIREDKDLHLNLALKSEVMSMILSYNPLWLRIGLETIYNELIPLKSNSDVVGLSTFISNRFLRDPYLIKKYKIAQGPKYNAEFKKFFLKKFLVLVYFLDQAKTKKLIPHDPCLFRKNSSIKESKEMLIKLARELLAAVGDITKYLKYAGYVVSHVQTYIHEFDYAVNNLGVDLRDGVRLTRVMEIILMEDNLTSNLRVPAISRLQKIHNMKIVFSSLEKAGFEILYDISPKDIVDGHKEKTLSFLWQIVYKFQAPLMVKSATTIQTWFRSLPVVLKRKRLERMRLRRETAATKIQTWYRRQKLIQKLERYIVFYEKYLLFVRTERAAIKIQSYYKMHLCKTIYVKQRNTVVNIQRFARGWLVRNIRRSQIKKAVIIQSYVRMYLARRRYLQLKNAVSKVLAHYQAKKKMQAARTTYVQQKTATIKIQRWIRSMRLLKEDKLTYTKLKEAAFCVQSRFRANRLCKTERQKYLEVRSATLRIQTWYRSIHVMRLHRQQFLALKKSVTVIEQRYVALRTMQSERRKYQDLKKACISIQQRYKAQLEMKIQRRTYLELRAVTVTVQNRYRANKLCRIEKRRFETLKSATLFIQRKFRAKQAMMFECRKYNRIREAATRIQVWFRATLEMRKCLTYYVSLKYAAHILEDRYRAKKLMEKEQNHYKQLRIATITLQTRYRALVSMRQSRVEFLKLKIVTVFVQRKFRANKLAQLHRMEYLKVKQAAVTIQQRYRAQLTMKEHRNEYLNLRKAATIIQERYRAKCLMAIVRKRYLNLLKYTLFVQQRFRANRAMLTQRKAYEKLRNSTVFIQRKWRANKIGKSQKQQYEELKKAVLMIQRRRRANKLCHQEKIKYEILKKSVLSIQNRWRAKKLCERTRSDYIQLRHATITCQSMWKAKRLKEVYYRRYLELKTATIFVQRTWRSNKLTMKQRLQFVTLRNSVVNIQSRWRANRLARKDRNNYLELKNAAVKIQTRWRAQKLSRQHKNRYVELRNATLLIQRRWRAKKLAKVEKVKYEALKMAVLTVQKRWRSKVLANKERCNYLQMKKVTIVLQEQWRAKVTGRFYRQQYEILRKTAVFIQRKWRANRLTNKEKAAYETLRHNVIKMQRYWRANKLTRIERENYLQLKSSTVIIQNWWRAQKIGAQQKLSYESLKKATMLVQSRWRANILFKKERNRYLTLKNAAVVVQSHWKRRQARNSYLQIRKATITTQRIWRAIKLRDQHKNYYESLRKYTIFVQRQWRANKLALADRTSYKALKNATLVTQTRWRAKQQGDKDRNNYTLTKKSAIVLQRRWRAKKLCQQQKQEYEVLRKTVIMIQSKWRAKKVAVQARNNFIVLRNSCTTVQQRWRALVLMKTAVQRYTLLRKCVIKIQIWFRATILMKRQREWYIKAKNSAILIQRYYRSYVSMKQLRMDFCVKRSTVVTLQRHVRGYLVRKRYADYFTAEAREKRKHERMKRAAATKIQALWRGHRSRSVDTPEIITIRNRVRTATLNAVPQNTLECRCRVALQALICKNTLSEYNKVLNDLDYITRHSRDVCANIALYLPEQMYLMIKTSNRSLPEMQACIYSVRILINVCKYKSTKSYSFFPDYIDGIVTVMMHWCDKESQLFSLLCTLFWLFAHTPEWKEFIVSLPNIQQRFMKIQTLLLRKNAMVRKAGIKGQSVFASYVSLPLPSLKPDWGLDYKHSPYAFSNSVHAFSSLLKILHM